MSCPPKREVPHLPSLWPFTFPLHLHVLAASTASHTPILVYCRTPLRPMLLCLLFFCARGSTSLLGLGFRFFTMLPSFHQTVEASCIMQGCINFFSFQLDNARSHLRHKFSSQHRSFLCKLVSFLIAFSDECFEERHLLHFSWSGVLSRARPSTRRPS